MPNSFIQAYQEKYRAQYGQEDPRHPTVLTMVLGKELEAKGQFDSIASKFPDFREEYIAQRNATRGSLADEFGAGVSSAFESLKGVAKAGVGLVARKVGAEETGDKLLMSAQENFQQSAEDAPTITRVQDIRGVGDAAAWMAGAAGQAVPSLAESAAVGIGGAVVGTATAPGAGTVAGALSGVATKGVAKQTIYSIIKETAEKLGKDATADMVRKEIVKTAAKRGGIVAVATNSYLLSSGEIYSELANDPEVGKDKAENIALAYGAVAALPDTFMPAYVMGKFFPSGVKKEALQPAARYWRRFLTEATKTMPIEAGTEAFQEAVNIAAERYAKEGEIAPTSFTPEERSRIMNAGAVGGVAGFGVTPLSAVGGGPVQVPKPQQEAAELPSTQSRLRPSAPRPSVGSTVEFEPVPPPAPETVTPPDTTPEVAVVPPVSPVAAPAVVTPTPSISQPSATPAAAIAPTPSDVVVSTPQPAEPQPQAPVVNSPPSLVSTVEPVAPAAVSEAAPISQPVATEPIATPEPTPTPEPVAEPTPEPVAEPTPEPVAEPTPEPVAEPTPEPVAEPTPEPVAEPTPTAPAVTPEPTPTAPAVTPEPTPTAEPVVEQEAATPAKLLEGFTFDAIEYVKEPDKIVLQGARRNDTRTAVILRDNNTGKVHIRGILNQARDPNGNGIMRLENRIPSDGIPYAMGLVITHAANRGRTGITKIGKKLDFSNKEKALLDDVLAQDGIELLGFINTNEQANIKEFVQDFDSMADFNKTVESTTVTPYSTRIPTVASGEAAISVAEVGMATRGSSITETDPLSTESAPERSGGVTADAGIFRDFTEQFDTIAETKEDEQALELLQSAGWQVVAAPNNKYVAYIINNGQSITIEAPKSKGVKELWYQARDMKVSPSEDPTPETPVAMPKMGESKSKRTKKATAQTKAIKEELANSKRIILSQVAAKNLWVLLQHQKGKLDITKIQALIQRSSNQQNIEAYEALLDNIINATVAAETDLSTATAFIEEVYDKAQSREGFVSILKGETIQFRDDAGIQSGYLDVKETIEFNRVLESLKNAGFSVEKVKQVADSADAFLTRENASVDRKRKIVRIVMADLYKPSRTNLIAAIHEAAHIVYGEMLPIDRVLLQRAVSSMEVESILADSTATNINNAEERLVEAIALALERDGFKEAQSVAQRIFNILKDLWIAFAVGAQRALLGDTHVSTEYAAAYFKMRVRNFITGQSSLDNFINSIGRPLTSGQRFHDYTPFNVGIQDVFDKDSGGIIQPAIIPQTIEDLTYSLSNTSPRMTHAARKVFADVTGIQNMQSLSIQDMAANINKFSNDRTIKSILALASESSLLNNVGVWVVPDAIFEVYQKHFGGDDSVYDSQRNILIYRERDAQKILHNQLAKDVIRVAIRQAGKLGAMERDGMLGDDTAATQDMDAIRKAYAVIKDVHSSMASTLSMDTFLQNILTEAGRQQLLSTPFVPSETIGSAGQGSAWNTLYQAGLELLGVQPQASQRDLDIVYRMDGASQSVGLDFDTYQDGQRAVGVATILELDRLRKKAFTEYKQAVGKYDTEAEFALKFTTQKVLDAPKEIGPDDRVLINELNPALKAQAKISVLKSLTGYVAKALKLSEGNRQKIKDAEIKDKADREKLEELRKKLEDRELLGTTSANEIRKMISKAVKDMRDGMDKVGNEGALIQTIKMLEGLADADPIPREYIRLFDSMLDSKKTSVFDYLQHIVKLQIDFTNTPVVAIREQIATLAQTNKAVANITSKENRGLLTAIIAYLKTHEKDIAATRIALSENKADIAAVRNELDRLRAMTDTQLDAIYAKLDAEDLSSEAILKREFVLANRRIRERAKRVQIMKQTEQEALLISQKLTQQVDDLRAELGEIKPFFAADGETAIWMKFNTKSGQWEKTDVTLKFDERNAYTLKAMRMENAEWLRTQEQNGLDNTQLYFQVKYINDKLNEVVLTNKHQLISRTLFERALQTLANKFGDIGLPGAKAIQRMLIKMELIERSELARHRVLSGKWTAAMQSAQKAFGYDSWRAFKMDVMDPVFHLIQNNPQWSDDDTVYTEAFSEATRVSQGVQAKALAPEARKLALIEVLKATEDIAAFEVGLRERYGERVKDTDVFTVDPMTGTLTPLFRKAVPLGRITTPRRMRLSLINMLTRDMAELGWLNTTGTLTNANEAKTFNEFLSAITPLFNEKIMEHWLVPFIYKPGEPVFKDIPQDVVQLAWEKAQGRLGDFIVNLGVDSGEITQKTEESSLKFAKSWMESAVALFQMELDIAKEATQMKSLDMAAPGRMQEARQNMKLPIEHVEYDGFDPQKSRSHLAEIAREISFGRGDALYQKNFESVKSELTRLDGDLVALERVYGITNKKGIQEAVGKERYKTLINARAQLGRLNNYNAEVNGYMRSDLSPFKDAAFLTELLSTITLGIVNTPKVALNNLMNLVDFPLIYRDTKSATAWKSVLSAIKTTGGRMLGSLVQAGGKQLYQMSEKERMLGDLYGKMLERNMKLKDFFANPGWNGNFEESWAKRGIQAMRLYKRALERGIGKGQFQPFNLFWAPMDFVTNNISVSVALAHVNNFEMLTMKGIKYFEDNPHLINDLNLKIEAKDIGVEAGIFEYFKRRMEEYGLGSVEEYLRDAVISRYQNKDGSPLKPNVIEAIGLSAMNDLIRDSNFNTRPSELFTNPVLKLMSPLLGWPLGRMEVINNQLRSPEGRMEMRAAIELITYMSVVALPVGIAYTMLIDEYDEELLGKKSNLRSVDPLWMVPVAGPVLAMLKNKGNEGDEFLGALERLSRSGNVYGLGMDMANGIIGQVDPNSSSRAISLDTRVVAMSTLLNVQNALRNLVNQQGYSYESVGRPLVYSLGGNGVLQGWQIFSNAFDIDSEEARVVRRIDVQNHLRAAGRETGLEIRRGVGSVAPTPTGRWMRQMVLAALANDRDAFRFAYENAKAARLRDPEADPYEDPAKYVLRSWKSRDPITAVFRMKPDEAEMRKLLEAMSPAGRRNTVEAIRLYNYFTTLIEPESTQTYNSGSLRSMTPKMPSMPTFKMPTLMPR